VGTGNRVTPASLNSTTKTVEDAAPEPTSTVMYSTAAESLKKLRGKLSKAQMPDGKLQTPSILRFKIMSV